MGETDEAIIEESIPLIAEELKKTRQQLGISSAKAASKVGIDKFRYRRLENCNVTRNRENAVLMISVAEKLGIEAVRMSWVPEIQQYMKLDTSPKRVFTVFVDSMSWNILDLKDMGYFVSPSCLIPLVKEIGVETIWECKNSIDKAMFELLVSAVVTLGMNRQGRDHYVRLVKDIAPDTEILTTDHVSHRVHMTKLEVTRYSWHEQNIYDVIKKKLRKRYAEGTVIVIFVSLEVSITVAELLNVIHTENTDDWPVCLLVNMEGKLKIISCGGRRSNSDELGWVESIIDSGIEGHTPNKYDGVVLRVPFMKRSNKAFPTYVKKVRLSL